MSVASSIQSRCTTLPAAPDCFGDQRLAQKLGGVGAHLGLRLAELHAACLAAPAGMDLRLDHAGAAAQLAAGMGRLFGG